MGGWVSAEEQREPKGQKGRLARVKEVRRQLSERKGAEGQIESEGGLLSAPLPQGDRDGTGHSPSLATSCANTPSPLGGKAGSGWRVPQPLPQPPEKCHHHHSLPPPPASAQALSLRCPSPAPKEHTNIHPHPKLGFNLPQLVGFNLPQLVGFARISRGPPSRWAWNREVLRGKGGPPGVREKT